MHRSRSVRRETMRLRLFPVGPGYFRSHPSIGFPAVSMQTACLDRCWSGCVIEFHQSARIRVSMKQTLPSVVRKNGYSAWILSRGGGILRVYRCYLSQGPVQVKSQTVVRSPALTSRSPFSSTSSDSARHQTKPSGSSEYRPGASLPKVKLPPEFVCPVNG